MTIKRVINGVEMEITLNSIELWDAYMEKQHEYDLEDIENYLEYYTEDEIMQEYGVTIDKFHSLKEEMACLYRKYRDNDESWARDRDEAVEYILSECR